MTTTAPRPTPTAPPVSPSAPRGRGGRDVVVVAFGAVAALLLAFVSQSVAGIAIVVALMVVVVGAVLLRNNPGLIVPAVIFSMWFEGIGSGQLSLGRVVAALVIALIAIRIVTSSWRPKALEPRAWLPIYLLMTWAWAGGLYAVVTGSSSGWFLQFLTLLLGVAYYLGMAVFLEGPAQLERLLRWFLIIGAPTAVMGLFIFLTLGNRVFGFNGGPNTYAAYIQEVLPFLVLFARREQGWRKVAWWLMLPIYLGGLISTGSRGGMVGCAVVGIYVFVTSPGWSLRRRVVMSVLGLFGMYLAYLVFAALNPTRFAFGAILSDRGAGRTDIWNAAFQVMREHFWIGLGLGGFPSKAIQFIQTASNGQIEVLNSTAVVEQGGINAHNVYLALTLDMGIIGLSLYLGVIAATLKNLWDLRRTEWGDLAWAFTGTLVGALAAGMFGAAYNQKFLWVTIGVAASAYYRRRLTPRPGSVPVHSQNGASVGAG